MLELDPPNARVSPRLSQQRQTAGTSPPGPLRWSPPASLPSSRKVSVRPLLVLRGVRHGPPGLHVPEGLPHIPRAHPTAPGTTPCSHRTFHIPWVYLILLGLTPHSQGISGTPRFTPCSQGSPCATRELPHSPRMYPHIPRTLLCPPSTLGSYVPRAHPTSSGPAPYPQGSFHIPQGFTPHLQGLPRAHSTYPVLLGSHSMSPGAHPTSPGLTPCAKGVAPMSPGVTPYPKGSAHAPRGLPHIPRAHPMFAGVSPRAPGGSSGDIEPPRRPPVPPAACLCRGPPRR